MSEMKRMKRLTGLNLTFHPMGPDKSPTCRGHSRMTCSRKKCWEGATGYGVVLEGLVCVDVDSAQVLLDYRDLIELTDTLAVRTARGKGGLHLYFLGDGAPSHTVKERFSLKSGEGHYLMGPGSTVVTNRATGATGTYEVVNAVPAQHWQDPGPGELIRALLEEVNETRTERVVGEVRELGKGDRNDGLTSIAGMLVRAGLDDANIERAVRDHNNKHVHPPLPEDELRTTILHSVKRWRS